jgi:hypothetical protein
MKPESTGALVRELMKEFTLETGLEPVSSHPKRYLWTDSFAVCNFLELSHQFHDKRYLDLALGLVDQVHHTLGRHRNDVSTKGWISGLEERKGELHPTRGGLRIGKELPERRPGEPLDEHLEWERDGQYYHYLTKWMHALNHMAKVTKDSKFILWATELAKTAHKSFTYLPLSGKRKRMYWKMSTDLKHPLISSMGQHDPLDGFVTYNELQTTAIINFDGVLSLNLQDEISDMGKICQGLSLATDDPLGIGGLLFDALRIARLMEKCGSDLTHLLNSVIEAARVGIDYYAQNNPLNYPPEYRLAFRELGLSIGLRGVNELHRLIKSSSKISDPEHLLQTRVEKLMEYVPLGKEIELFWIDSENRHLNSWKDHQEINMVMLATSLAPDVFLSI